jgi:hypothetical protein
MQTHKIAPEIRFIYLGNEDIINILTLYRPVLLSGNVQF